MRRSRTRSPGGGSYRSYRHERPLEMKGRSRSRSPYNSSSSRKSAHRQPPTPAVPAGSSHSSSSRPRPSKSPAAAAAATMMTPSISLVNTQEFITRSITNPEEVKIPRRVDEGLRPIFDREELRESIARRMRAGDNEVNPTTHVVPETSQQRVIAIIREPLDPAGYSRLQLQASAVAGNSAGNSQPQPVPLAGSTRLKIPEQPNDNNSYRPHRHVHRPTTPVGRPPSPRHPSPRHPGSHSRSIERAREREGDGERDRKTLAEIEAERLRERERDRHRPHSSSRPYPRRRSSSRHSPDVRRTSSRWSKSRSRTPPHVPRHVVVEREREIRERDLRSSLSRPPGNGAPSSKFYEESSYRGRGAGFLRGRGVRSRGRSRGYTSSSFRARGMRRAPD